jgi:hypothetical protein
VRMTEQFVDLGNSAGISHGRPMPQSILTKQGILAVSFRRTILCSFGHAHCDDWQCASRNLRLLSSGRYRESAA